ncbi:autotransporter family protein [Cupriavidus pinatubonensis]|uniref:Autotransporter domain-containing protein n=1 Tax=Cupriavidus pinatubonensis TaxID=248026 RepID=A0ABM8Y2I6_9BURK|nr:autotransporter outer membrane beta-barrel domain-containing protein [Cupriavidus pinatubonensis]CAG9186968.1 hypothetical protein LMG23994_06475 [Cupriavidus pinatubonensis]
MPHRSSRPPHGTWPATVLAVALGLRPDVALAACDLAAPADGQTATCTPLAPNPATTPIVAQPGSSRVTVTIEPNAELAVAAGSAVVVREQSLVDNGGTLRGTGDAAPTVLMQGTGNTLDNRGTIIATGTASHAVFVDGNAPATVRNSGTLLATGTDSSGLQGGTALTVTNTAAGRILSDQSNAIFANHGITLDNAGLIHSDATSIIVNNGPSSIDNTGTIESLSGNAIGATRAAVVITNRGTISGGFRAIDLDVGNDVVNMLGGTIRGAIVLREGDDRFEMSGGQVDAVDMGPGRDTVVISGGQVNGAIALGDDSDAATLRGLTDANLAGMPRLDGGSGLDSLTLDQSRLSGVARLVGFEAVNLTNHSTLVMDGDLVLGDPALQAPAALGLQRPLAVTAPTAGTLDIDSTSTLQIGPAGNAAIVAASAGQLAAVNNAGVIDLTTGSTPAASRLQIVGHYTGNGGQLLLRSILGADNSPSDRLGVSQGTVSGSTTIALANAGGNGGLTVVDGIPLVLVTDGGTSTPSAFRLAGGQIQAGAYVYVLYHGGVSNGTADSWFLRSSLAPASSVSPAPPSAGPQPVLSPQPAAGSPALPPAPAADASPVPLYRPAVPVYAAIAGVSRQLGVDQIATFHERQGEQALLTERGALGAAWARVWGSNGHQSQGGEVHPDFSGTLAGLQIGQDLYAMAGDGPGGHRDHFGAYFGYARAAGDIAGFALGFPGYAAGKLDINAYSVGAYWSHIGPGNWYTDTVLQYSTLTIDPSTHTGTGATTHGNALALSAEGGMPLPLSPTVTLEPQVQLVWQHLSLNDLQDQVSTVTFRNADSTLARAGVRLQKVLEYRSVRWQPWLRTDILHALGGTDQTTFAATTSIPSSQAYTAARFEAGIAGKAGRRGSVYGTVGYLTSLDGVPRSAWFGNIGARWSW